MILNMTIDNNEFRKNSLLRLIFENGGQAQLARKINKNILTTEKNIVPAQISQIINGRAIGERLCRKIERALKLQKYWFDFSAEDQDKLTIDQDTLELAKAINSLHPSQRKILRAAIIDPDVDAEFNQEANAQTLRKR